jgi:toxin ParE1/3/4
MPGVLKRPQALADVAEIWAYIADDSPANAEAFAALIDTKLQALGRQPGMGRNRDELHQYLRSFPDRYVIFYLPCRMVSKSSGCFIAHELKPVAKRRAEALD